MNATRLARSTAWRTLVRCLVVSVCASFVHAAPLARARPQASPLPGRSSAELRARMKAVADPDPQAGYAAYQELIPFGERLAPAVPELRALLAEERLDVRQWASSLCYSLDWEAEPLLGDLRKLLDSDDPVLQANAAAALGNLGAVARDAAPRLRALVDSGQGEVPGWALYATARVDPARALADERADLRIAGLRVLNDAPPRNPDPALVARLLEMLHDADEEARAGAACELANALLDLDAGARSRIGPVLVEALEHETVEPVLEQLIAAAGRVPEQASVSVPRFEALAREHPELHASALHALGELGPAAAPALAFILESTKDVDPEVRDAALYDVVQVAPGSKETLAAIRGALADASSRGYALGLLRYSVLPPAEWLEDLVAALETADKVERAMVLDALARLQAAARPAVANVRAQLASAALQPAAAHALLCIDTSPPSECWKILVDGVLSEDFSERHRCRVYLADLAKTLHEPHDRLHALLAGQSPPVRLRAALAMLQLDAADHEALQALVKARQDGAGTLDDEIRQGNSVPAAFWSACAVDQIALIDMLAAIGAPARKELTWLRTARGRATPEMAARIDKCMRTIRGLEEEPAPAPASPR